MFKKQLQILGKNILYKCHYTFVGQIPLVGLHSNIISELKKIYFKKSQNIDFERSSNIYVSLENIES